VLNAMVEFIDSAASQHMVVPSRSGNRWRNPWQTFVPGRESRLAEITTFIYGLLTDNASGPPQARGIT
jgi:hypothetical protein